MRKLYFFCLILLTLMMVSCKDDSGEFIDQYYTDAQLTTALRTCLTAAKDTAFNLLCAPDGLNGSETYRIILPDNADFRTLSEILTAENKSYLTDSLVCQLNRACEQAGNTLSSSFGSSISSLTFSDPSSLVYSSSSDAATNYFRTQCGIAMQSAANSAVSEQMQATGASNTWSEIQSTYYTATSTFFNYDITIHTATLFLTAVYTEMAKEEALIRSDATHATAGNLTVFRR